MAENEPGARIEEQVMRRLGFDQYLDAPVPIGRTALGRNFLDAYPEGSPHKEETENLLHGFMDMPADDPDYPDTAEYITGFLSTQFGPPQSEA